MSRLEKRRWQQAIVLILSCEGFCPPLDMYEFMSDWAKCLQR
jgi:hypothetical protein